MLFLSLFALVFSWISWVSANTDKCKFDENSYDIAGFLSNCKAPTLAWKTDYDLEQWAKTQVNEWITNVSLVLWFIAVAMLVYAGMLFQFSGWEDEQINKAKNVVKMTLIGFVLLISASSIVYIVINVFYSLAS